jgi:hypothetical protein
LAGGILSPRGSPHDLVTKRAGIQLEVKCSSLLTTRGQVTRRWVWTKIHGETGGKRFDRLILVGDCDPQFRHHYRDPKCPYIFFDIPFSALPGLTYGIRRGRSSVIHLTTNPKTVKAVRAQRLFREFQTTTREIERRYGLRSTWIDRQSNLSLQRRAASGAR